MAAGNTYTAIATQTLGSAAASVTFSSIPATYTDLVLIVSNLATTSASQNIKLRVGNGSLDTGTNYSCTVLAGNGTSASSARQSSVASMIIGAFQFGTDSSQTTPFQVIAHIMNYSNTTTYKSVLSRDASSNQGTELFAGLWRSTSAIDTVSLLVTTSTLLAGTVATLYGILAA